MSGLIPAALVGRDFASFLIEQVKQAKQSIDFVVFDWRWYPDQLGSTPQIFSREVIAASKRGVAVRVLTNTLDTVSIFKKEGIQARRWQGGKILHVKMAIFDQKYLLIGSHNYTMNAFNLNQEVSVFLDDAGLLTRLTEYYNGLWSL